MPVAHLSDKDFAAIGAAFTAFITANHRASIEYAEWPAILGPDLFTKAVQGGYFGAQGSIPGFPYGDIKAVGFQVASGTRDTGPGGEISVRYYALLKDGVEIARKDTASLEEPDPMEWAKELGYDVTDHG